MRYIIIGAGAVGATIGARLFEHGHEVVLVARGEHHAAMRERGLRFATPAGQVTLPVPVVSGPGGLSLRADDALILTVKAQDSVAALDAWAWRPVAGGAVAAEVLPVFCAQNGVASERFALRRFSRVYGVCVWLPATYLRAGEVQAQAAPMTGLLPVGRYPAGEDETARRVAAGLAGSTFLAPVMEDVMRWKHGKLLTNLANAVEAVCGPSGTEDGNAAGAAELRRRARKEGTAVLDAAGIAYSAPAELERLRGDQLRIEPVAGERRTGGSSWQSLTRGTGSIEADYLNGEIVLLAREHGVPAPVNELLQRLANRFAADRRAPGSVTPAEMAALLAG